ncbi:MAG: cardiolipin synthase [Candidatus Vogelbacteria bacterium]|nr:cardiolipin synthase [Candidatus Vogelbacteria bacterium]
MQNKKLLLGLVCGAVCVSWFFYLYTDQRSLTSTEIGRQKLLTTVSAGAVSSQKFLSLIVEPDDGMTQVKNAIKGARHSIDFVIYELEDVGIEKDLVAAFARGVKVRVILQNVKNFGTYPNDAAYKYLKSSGVDVKWAEDYFALTHQKTLVVDNTSAIIMTFNLNSKYYTSSRDFAVIDTDPNDIAAISQVFGADWNGTGIIAPSGDDLVWSPGSADILLLLINSASSSLDVYNEEMADYRITNALEKAAERGVAVRVIMTYSSSWKTALNELTAKGVVVHTYSGASDFYIHAKVIVADRKLMFVGSENFSLPSLDKNRELGTLVSDPELVAKTEHVFAGDWVKARPFEHVPDLSFNSTVSIVKLSTSNICHVPGSASYEQTKKFKSYETLQACLDSGGRLPIEKNQKEIK